MLKTIVSKISLREGYYTEVEGHRFYILMYVILRWKDKV
jgi:hypothetical protein